MRLDGELFSARSASGIECSGQVIGGGLRRQRSLLLIVICAATAAACGTRDGQTSDSQSQGASSAELSSAATGASPEVPTAQTDGRPAGITIRDSAGISIVEVDTAFLNRLPVWSLGKEPVLTIGAIDGEAPYLFDGIKRTSVAPFEDGSTAIVDGQSSLRGTFEIRTFDARGRFIRSTGRKGQGPGEFSSPPDIRARSGGGIMAQIGPRIVMFDAAGKMQDTWEVGVPDCPFRCSDRAALANGSLTVYSTNLDPFARGMAVGQVLDGLKVHYGLATRDTVRVVAEFDMPPRRALRREARTLSSGATSPAGVAVSAPLLSASPESGIIAGQEHFAVARHNPFEFRIYDTAAKHVRTIRILRPPRRVSGAEREAMIAESNAQLPMSGRTVADLWPEFDYVRFGENDELWVMDYLRNEDDPDAHIWFTIFGSDGVPVARLDARKNPLWKDQSRSTPHQVFSSRDFYRTITRDSLGVNRLVVFAINKSR